MALGMIIFIVLGVCTAYEECPCQQFNIIEKTCNQSSISFCTIGTQVIGGEDGSNEDWPYIVSLQIPVASKGAGCYAHFCAGSLIHDNIILSAAHCVEDILDGIKGVPQVDVFVSHAPVCRHQGSGIGNIGNRLKVEYIEIHPLWNRSLASGDIAILILNETLPGPYVQLQKQFYNPITSEPIMIAGYGSINPQEQTNRQAYNMRKLQQATLKYLDPQLCRFYLNKSDSKILEVLKEISPKKFKQQEVQLSSKKLDSKMMICAFDQKMDTCKGDSGGPAVLKGKIPREDVLVGVTSWGPANQCLTLELLQAPAIFMRVSYYVDWIEKSMIKYSNLSEVEILNEDVDKFDPLVASDDLMWVVEIP